MAVHQSPLLELRDVSKSYPGPSPVPVLRHASFVANPGESIAIVGPSGSGKTTILNLIGSLDTPEEGAVFLDGREISHLDAKELAHIRNRRIGFVFQNHHLLPHCSVMENVLAPCLAESATVPREARDRAEQLLARVGLKDRTSHLPGRLSGGERQRCAVVRALINRPVLLLADEPTGALDRSSAAEVGRLLVELNREESVTLVVVTHSAELASQMNRQVEVRDGGLVEVGMKR